MWPWIIKRQYRSVDELWLPWIRGACGGVDPWRGMTACEQDQDETSWSCPQAISIPVWHIPLLCVQWKTPDDGQGNCPQHVEFHSEHKFEKLVHLVGFIIRNLARCMVTWTSKKTTVKSILYLAIYFLAAQCNISLNQDLFGAFAVYFSLEFWLLTFDAVLQTA